MRNLWEWLTESRCFLLIRIGAAARYIRRLEADLATEKARREHLERILKTSISDRLDHANCRVLKRNDA